LILRISSMLDLDEKACTYNVFASFLLGTTMQDRGKKKEPITF